MKYIKSYGVAKLRTGKYAVCTQIDDTGHHTIHYSLAYKRMNFAAQKAEQFIRACHKNFIDFKGESIEFEFKNYGLINE